MKAVVYAESKKKSHFFLFLSMVCIMYGAKKWKRNIVNTSVTSVLLCIHNSCRFWGLTQTELCSESQVIRSMDLLKSFVDVI